MEKMLPRVKNFNVSVKEVGGKVIFMRKLVPGGSEHSFGIHVAKIAGMAPDVVKRAEQVLKELEANNSGDGISRPKTETIQTVSKSGVQLSFFQLDDPVLCQIRDEIANLDINSLTPIEALNKLNEIKKIVKGR
jgi:DNA mismatch repair protein MutS